MSVNKKITILSFSLDHGGAEKVCLTICNELIKRNYEIELWIFNYKETSLTKKLDKKVKLVRLYKKRVRNSFFPLLKLLIKQRPDKLLIFHLELAVLSIFFKKLLFLNTKIVVRSINTISHAFQYPKGIWEKYFALKIIKIALPCADKIIAQSTGMRDDLVRLIKTEGEKIITIYNPAININSNGTNNNAKNSEKTEFLYVGRLNPQKGLFGLIEAFRLVYNECSNIHLSIVGDGSEKEKLERKVNDLGLSSSISFEGFQSNTYDYFQEANATVLTSVFEGFPNVLVESIAAGTPVISYDCPSGPKDIVVQGVNGILVPDQDVKGFSEAMLALIRRQYVFDKEEVIETSNKFKVDSIVNDYEQVFFDL